MPQHLTVLHISDIQFGRNHRFGNLSDSVEPGAVSFETLLQRLIIDLDSIAKAGASPDLIVVSGDLAELGIKKEFDDALQFLSELSQKLAVPKNRIIIIPGNHDINRKLCEGYFAMCQGDSETPKPPYGIKWKHYAAFFEKFYEGIGLTFSSERPWTFYEIPELKVVVAGMNSTIAESHLDDSHYGQVGEEQLRWFSEKLSHYKEEKWLRLGVVHHNLERGAVLDEENLRDKDDLKRILGPFLNAVFHGHTHESRIGWLDNNVPILSTGSAALKKEQRPEEVGNQYQLVQIKSNSITRWLRRYDPGQKMWIGDTRYSENGNNWIVTNKLVLDDVSEALESSENVVLQAQAENPQVVLINQPVDEEVARKKLESIPRVKLILEKQHRAVRQEEQQQFSNTLKSQQVIWVSADWAQGKDGFLACALERLGGVNALSYVYRLQCGSASNCEDLLSGAEIQLGLSFQEFSAAAAAVPLAVLILEDIPAPILHGLERESLERKLQSILDFCPGLKIVLSSRLVPRGVNSDALIILKALDSLDVREYLKNHQRPHLATADIHVIEQAQVWSGGLPMHLDRLLDRLEFLPLSQILNEEGQLGTSSLAEAVPQGLINTVASLANSQNPQSVRSMRLLKVLTILRDGETFQSVRRFYKKEPFHQANIDELMQNSLVESVLISQAAPEIRINGIYGPADRETPRLLKVPKQVRDYVNSIISDEDRDEIVSTSMPLFFGNKWWEKITLRNTIQNAYGESVIAGPGNEHVVIRRLLSKSIERGIKRQVSRYSRLATNYCSKLLDADRFRDANMAAGAMIELIAEADDSVAQAEIGYMYGKALRMTGQHREAINILEQAISTGGKRLIDDFKADIHLNLAYAYKRADRESDARNSAEEVLKLAHADSSCAYQAEAIIADMTLKSGALKEKLMEIEARARGKGFDTAADNIALDLAKGCDDPNEALTWLEKVLRPGSDGYNRARAIVERASILVNSKRIREIRESDFRILCAAYSYCYAQRIGNLLDRCHRILWELCKRSGEMSSMLRLYRFSSFIWRLRDEETRDLEYLRDLVDIDVVKLSKTDAGTLRMELGYFEKRRTSYLAIAVSTVG